MDASEAREHLRHVDRIIAATDRTLRVPPAMLIGIGGICSVLTGVQQARLLGLAVPPDQYLHLPMIAVIIGIAAISRLRSRRQERETLVAGYAGTAFLMAFVVAMTLNVTAQHRTIPAEGMGVVWSASFAMSLLIAGAMGSRLLLGGGAAMLMATAASSLVPGWLPGVLAIGWLLGFFVPGLVLALEAPDGRTAAL